MSVTKKEISREDMVDKFIAVANELAVTESKERIGAALMFAASRYNAYEASTKTENLAIHRGDAVGWYTKEYQRMLNANLDEMMGI